MNPRQLFLRHVAQTSPAPIGIDIVQAAGNYLYDASGKRYLDLIGGISVCNIGHTPACVVEAIQKQTEKYLHVMVYGELIQSPQVEYAALLCAHLPQGLDSVYFTNSGAEATEGALKLARRLTGRPKIAACRQSYHGATLGALSVMGDEYWRNAFRPLMPGVGHYDYNSQVLIDALDTQTACVLIEPIQAEAGVIEPNPEWLKALREKCSETGVLLIYDEIQTGFGRTGKLWGWQQAGIVPDVLLLGKALGGGMPMGAFIASRQRMQAFTHDPMLGHMTTFGGHPVCCAAGMAALQYLLQTRLFEAAEAKAAVFKKTLIGQHPAIKAVRHQGLLLAVELESNAQVVQVLQRMLDKGYFSDWFLFAPQCIRIAPPLTITQEELQSAAAALLACLG
jgi:acetylornithine/succinyldiaminopimelate/putrescine aminotransferase